MKSFKKYYHEPPLTDAVRKPKQIFVHTVYDAQSIFPVMSGAISYPLTVEAALYSCVNITL